MPQMTYVGGRATGSPHVLIAIPTGTGQLGGQLVCSLFESITLLDAAGVRMDFCLEAGNCHVDDARNSIVRQFLKTDCTDLVFIDSDVGWRSQDLLALVKYQDADIVAGVYPKKQDDVDFPVFMEAGKEIWAREDGLIEVIGAPTGFMRIRRHVLEKLVETHKDRAFKGQGDQDGAFYHPIFERVIEAGRRWSGDYAFCRKWRALGGKIFVAPEMEFTHEGNKVWAGCLGDHLRNKAGLFHPNVSNSIERLKTGDINAIDALVAAWGNPFAATSELCFAAYNMAKRGGNILETGSGVSTLIMALAGAKVYSLEHDLHYLARTRKALDKFGLSNVELIYAPLKDYGEFVWYSLPENLPDLFSGVLCDGPQRRYGRDGLFRLLKDKIKGTLIVDDADDGVSAMLKKYFPERKVEVMGTLRKFAVAVEKQDG